ncbi:MAG TPA: class I SAM-dependent methyltransferase [Actinospica sp.]|nr:class I SAM-dependent methyltransferase [Actinospica sp.]
MNISVHPLAGNGRISGMPSCEQHEPAAAPRTGSVMPSPMPVDYDSDPQRYAANQEATRRFSARGDVHAGVARRLADAGCRAAVDIGGGNGTLARFLADEGVRAVVVDQAAYVADAPAPAVRASALRLPFRDESFDAAAALWMLYHLADPVVALLEARRVLRPGGLMAVAAPSRYNDPELGDVLPGWGEPSSFDAENGVGMLGEVFEVVDVERWDEPMVHLPGRADLELFLRGRGLSVADAAARAARFGFPLHVTKRGMVAWCRKPDGQPTSAH